MYEKINVEEAKSILKYVALGYKVSDTILETIKKVAIKEIEEKNRTVILKRDPNIERNRVQAAYAKIVDGNTIDIHPATVVGYGADFDGDSAICDLQLIDNKGLTTIKTNIKHLTRYVRLQQDKQLSPSNSNSKKVTNYKLLEEYYINAIDNETGNINKKLVTHWSIHENLKMYKIQRKPRITQCSNFIPFWVSEDHSLVAFKKDTQELVRTNVFEIMNNKENYLFIKTNLNEYENIPTRHVSYLPYSLIENMPIRERLNNLNLTYDHLLKIKKSDYCLKEMSLPDELIQNSELLTPTTKTLLKYQNENKIEFIPCEYLDIEYDPTETTGYDLTVEDYKTFCTVDGIFLYDTMAVYIPISKEAQEESKKKLISVTSGFGIDIANFDITKEALTGIYTLTYKENSGKAPVKINIEDSYGLHPWTQVEIFYKNEKIFTTAGRIIFNMVLPTYYPFVNEPVDKKKLNAILSSIIPKSKSDYADTVDKVMKLGFKYGTKYGRSISLDTLSIPPDLVKLKEDLIKEKDINVQYAIVQKMERDLMAHLKNNVPDLHEQIASGAAKGGQQLRQVMVAKGLITDSNGNILPVVKESMVDGYTPESYFNSSAASRKGVIDRSLMTAHGGYSFRKGVFVVGNVEADYNIVDCGTRRTLNIKLTKQMFLRMKGRYIQTQNGIKPVDESMIGHIINLRSPVFCISRKICRRCYGDLLQQINTRNVGVLAAGCVLSLSESIMKCSSGLVTDTVNNRLISFDDIWEEN